MLNDRLKRRIAAALAHASARDALAMVLRGAADDPERFRGTERPPGGTEAGSSPDGPEERSPDRPEALPPDRRAGALPDRTGAGGGPLEDSEVAAVLQQIGDVEDPTEQVRTAPVGPDETTVTREQAFAPFAPVASGAAAAPEPSAAPEPAPAGFGSVPAGFGPSPADPEATGDETSLQAILDNVKDAIVTVDGEGRVRRANAAASRLLCIDPADLPGRPISAFIPSLEPADAALAALAERAEDTLLDLRPTPIEGRRGDGEPFMAEVTVSAAGARRDGRPFYVLCMRDVTERMQNEQALRESEARYRALVENAPEAIVVFDVDQDRFVDANENAARLFKMPREELLKIGPREISPERQADGLPSFGLVRGYVDRALKGGSPVFEWLHCDSSGEEIPCEVRFLRLPSSTKRLIRASIIDITARRRADTLAHGERRVLELIAANAPLERTLQAVVRLVETLYPELHAALMRLDTSAHRLRLAACGSLPAPLKDALEELPLSLAAGPCGAAASLGRQVVVTDIARDPLLAELRGTLEGLGIASCCSTPIVTAGDRIHGTLAIYCTAPRGPKTEELDLVTRLAQLAGIAIRRKLDETALRESEARYRGLFDNVVDGVFQTTVEGDLISANPALMRMLGLDEDEPVESLRIIDFYADPKDRERLLAALAAGDGFVRGFEYRLKRRNGGTMVVVENCRLVKDADGRPLYLEGTVTDVTERKAAEQALFREKERAQVTLQSIGDAVLTTDASGRIEYLNPVAEQLTGWERRDAQGKSVQEIIQLTDEETGAVVEPPVLRCLAEGRTVTLTSNVVLTHRLGGSIAIQDSAAPIQDRSGRVIGAVMVFHDVSRERQLHRKLSYYASHDSLTGFINRREFEERLSAAVRAVRQDGAPPFALLYMDLDQFKVVNDTWGHAAGDLLLRQLAEILKARVRSADVIARLGGDEFAVLLADCPVQRAVEIADALREAIAQFRFTWRDGSLQVGVSIGVVPVDASAESVGSVLSAADVACYVAKDLGRNRIHVYEEGDAAERHQEMQWVARINRAREEERFELFYQPIVPIGDTRGAVPMYELLLRMRNERGDLVPPTTFIPAAERYNLMPSLDRWVISQVMGSLVYREDDACEPYMLAVNLSGTTLSDGRFVDFLLDELHAENVPPGALCFEITETAAIANLGNVVSFMRALKERGCRFSLDDFGTGLSSLTYLKHLPVDYLKIDGQFIRNVTRDPADESMVEAIARMAKALRIQTVAERVEGRDVLKRLGEIGISFAQGFFIAVPQPVSELPVRRAERRRA
ncbi:MAG TPA: EAL domain-containing protein [Gammaproteobacteria bacterium]